MELTYPSLHHQLIDDSSLFPPSQGSIHITWRYAIFFLLIFLPRTPGLNAKKDNEEAPPLMNGVVTQVWPRPNMVPLPQPQVMG